MAKVITAATAPPPWRATIRCAEVLCVGSAEVIGCFALIEIEKADLVTYSDFDGDCYLQVTCPGCNRVLNPKWQLNALPKDLTYPRKK